VSTAHRETLTEAEYLTRERSADEKHEFLAGEAWAMAGGSVEHNRLATNVLVALGRRLAGGSCYPLNSDQRVAIGETGLYTYPDVTVVCGDAERHPLDDTVLTNPSLVVEVLSEATEAYDRGAKAQHYRQRASLRTYVLVAQDRRHVEVYQRGADSAWSLREYVGDAVIALPTLGIEVPLDEVYAGVR
jgi:Uma2 family endonuclease